MCVHVQAMSACLPVCLSGSPTSGPKSSQNLPSTRLLVITQSHCYHHPIHAVHVGADVTVDEAVDEAFIAAAVAVDVEFPLFVRASISKDFDDEASSDCV